MGKVIAYVNPDVHFIFTHPGKYFLSHDECYSGTTVVTTSDRRCFDVSKKGGYTCENFAQDYSELTRAYRIEGFRRFRNVLTGKLYEDDGIGAY